MGEKFVEPPPFNIDLCFADSNCYMPMLFILSPGSDPMDDFYKFANDQV